MGGGKIRCTTTGWDWAGSPPTALAIGVMLSGDARAQCGAEVTAGLRFPLGIALSNQNNLLISESGTAGVLHSGRISIVGTDGIRRTLLDGLPSATNDVNEASGPAGLVMRGRTLYVAIGIGDTIQVVAPGSPVRVGNPNPASPIFSSVLAVHFSAHVEKTTAGFSLTTADYDALANGQTLKLSNGGGDKITIELVADFPDYIPNPLPTAPNNVRGSNPFDVELIGDQLYVTDGGRNLVWQADIHTRCFRSARGVRSDSEPHRRRCTRSRGRADRDTGVRGPTVRHALPRVPVSARHLRRRAESILTVACTRPC